MKYKQLNTVRWAPLLLGESCEVVELCSLADLQKYLNGKDSAGIDHSKRLHLVFNSMNEKLSKSACTELSSLLAKVGVHIYSISFLAKNNFYFKNFYIVRWIFGGKKREGLYVKDVRGFFQFNNSVRSQEYWSIFGEKELRWLIVDCAGQYSQHLSRRGVFQACAKKNIKKYFYKAFMKCGGYIFLEPWKLICVKLHR